MLFLSSEESPQKPIQTNFLASCSSLKLASHTSDFPPTDTTAEATGWYPGAQMCWPARMWICWWSRPDTASCRTIVLSSPHQSQDTDHESNEPGETLQRSQLRPKIHAHAVGFRWWAAAFTPGYPLNRPETCMGMQEPPHGVHFLAGIFKCVCYKKERVHTELLKNNFPLLYK